MNKIENLTVKNGQLAGSMEALAAAAEADGRNLTPEEQTKFDEYDAEFRSNQAEIARLQRLEEVKVQMSAPMPRVVQPIDPPSATEPPRSGALSVTGGDAVAEGFAHKGFTKGFGEYLLKVREAATHNGRDPRLKISAVTTWAGESVPADGGFALPPQFLQGIMSLVLPQDSFLRAFNPLPTNSDIINVPSDEDPPWGTSGVTAAKTAEGVAITASKPVIKNVKIVMYSIKALVHVDEKSLRDMAFLAAFVQRKMGEKIRWKTENYVLNGTGDGEPLGILNAPGLVSVTDINSTATSIGPEDLGLMQATALAGGGPGFWVMHPLIKPQVQFLKSGTGGFPLFTPDATVAPRQTLLGDAMYVSEACKGVNTTGDLFYVKPDGYFIAFEAGGVRQDTTIAFAFDQNLQSFRATLSMGGAPSLSAKVLRADATNYASNLVALAGSRS